MFNREPAICGVAPITLQYVLGVVYLCILHEWRYNVTYQKGKELVTPLVSIIVWSSFGVNGATPHAVSPILMPVVSPPTI